MKYPPFCDIIVIGFNSTSEDEIKKSSQEIFEKLENRINKNQFKVFKPMPSPIDKIQNKFRWRIIIKGKMTEEANKSFNDILKEIYEKNYKNTKITIDVNPNNMT